MQEGTQTEKLFQKYAMYSNKHNTASVKSVYFEDGATVISRKYASNPTAITPRPMLPKSQTHLPPFRPIKRRESNNYKFQDYLQVGEVEGQLKSYNDDNPLSQEETSENEDIFASQIYFKKLTSSKLKEGAKQHVSSHPNLPTYPMKPPFNMTERESRPFEARSSLKSEESSAEVINKGRFLMSSPELTHQKPSSSKSATQLTKYVNKKDLTLAAYRANSTALTPKEVKNSLAAQTPNEQQTPLLANFHRKRHSSQKNLKLLIKNFESGGTPPKSAFKNSPVLGSIFTGAGSNENLARNNNLGNGVSIIRPHVNKPFRIKKRMQEVVKLDAILSSAPSANTDSKKAYSFFSNPLSTNTMNGGLTESESGTFFISKSKKSNTLREEIEAARNKIQAQKEKQIGSRTLKKNLTRSLEDATDLVRAETETKPLKVHKVPKLHQGSVDFLKDKAPGKVQIPKLHLSVLHNKISRNDGTAMKSQKTAEEMPDKPSGCLTKNQSHKDLNMHSQRAMPTSPYLLMDTAKVRDTSNQRTAKQKEAKSPSLVSFKKSDTQCSTRLNSIGFISPPPHSQQDFSQLPTVTTRASKISLPLNLEKVQQVDFNDEFLQKVDEFSESWRLEARELTHKGH